MFFCGLVMMGIIAFRELKVNLLPNIEYPRITVVTTYGNAAPEEIENLITRPLSEAVGTVSSIEKVESESLEGVSFITLQFAWGTSIDFAAMEVREKLDLVRGSLPQDASRPIVTRFDPSQTPFMEIAFFGKGAINQNDLRQFIKDEVKVYLERADGVALVQLAGGFQREVQVDVDQGRLAAHKLSLRDLRDALAASNLSVPAGHITVGSRDVLVRSLGEFKDLEDIRRTIVGRNDKAVTIPLSDVADVHDGFKERTGLAHYNGHECVVASLYKEAGKNTVQVSQNAAVEIERIRKRFGNDVEVHVVYDESRFIKNSIGSLYQEIFIGGTLAFIALLLLLRGMRSPLILLTILPVSIFTTFIPLYFYNISLNMMSLGGLELSIGMLFDAGNVVLAAIQRHSAAGLTPKEAALKGGMEVSGSVTSAILTTILVFLPIVFIKSVVGVVFAEMALTISISSLVSLFVSLTLIPTLCSLRMPYLAKIDLEQLRPMRRVALGEKRLSQLYIGLVGKVLDNPARLFRIVGILFLLACAGLPLVQRSFIPRVDIGEFFIDVRLPRGSSLAATSDLVTSIERKLEGKPDIAHVLSRVGYDDEQLLARRSGDLGTHIAQIRVIMPADRNRTARELAGILEKEIQTSNDVEVNFVVRSDILSGLLSPDSRAITLELSGDDLQVLGQTGTKIKDDLKKISGVSGVSTSMEDQASELHVRFDDVRMAKTGFSHSTLGELLKSAIFGDVATRLHRGDRDVDVRLRMRREDRATLDNVQSMLVSGGKDSGTVYLSQIADISPGSGYTSIIRSGATRVNRITADVAGRELNNIYSRLDSYIAEAHLPPGMHISYAGERDSIRKSFRELLYAFILSVVLIYMLLCAQFESFKYPLIMLGTIPVILIGIVPAFLVFGKSFNISSFAGIILLVGIVVDNASLFYEYVEILLEEGFALRDSIIAACKICFKPILLNNGTTMLGMIPVALELGEGAEFQSPMALAVIAGLLTSVILTLLVIPALCFIFMRREHEVKVATPG